MLTSQPPLRRDNHEQTSASMKLPQSILNLLAGIQDYTFVPASTMRKHIIAKKQLHLRLTVTVKFTYSRTLIIRNLMPAL